MKNKLNKILWVILLCSSVSHAGVGSSGGGIGVMCNGKLRILDIYEAEEIHHLTIPDTHTTFDEYLNDYATKMANHLAVENPDDYLNPFYDFLNPLGKPSYWMDGARYTLQMSTDVPAGTLAPTNDATLPPLKAGCSFVQIFSIKLPPNAFIRKDLSLWNQLDAKNQAALLMHEELYYAARDAAYFKQEHSGMNSDEVRRIVGLLVSNTLPQSIIPKSYARQEYLNCSNLRDKGDYGDYPTKFRIYNDTQNGVSGVRFFFTDLDGKILVSNTSIFVPNQSIKNILRSGDAFPKLEMTHAYFSD